MRKSQISDWAVPLLIFVDGLICILTARYAFEIGLDPDEAWGRTRFVLLTLGVILLLTSSLMIVLKYRKVNSGSSIWASEKSRTLFILFHLWAVILLIYAWFITYGTFTKWDHTSNYYSQLADAFGNRQLFLDIEPSEAILAAADPYNPQNRPRQEEIWDMSLYKGRIYLYWGPLPAVLIAPVQRLFNVKILDIYLDFFFYAGLLIVNSMILLKLRKDFFPNISIWNVFVCIALAGLIAPVLWALIPTTIYGTAIGAGNFFLMGGIYFILTAFDQEPVIDSKRLFLAGLFWTCSIGSRALNTPSILFLAILAAIWIARMNPRPFRWTKYFQTIIPLFIPMVFGAIASGWYNWARFDSPLEFGLRYQITFFNLNKDLGLTIQPDYFLPNLYVYLLQPFRLTPNFPFAVPIYAPDIFARQNMVFPKMFFAGRMTGLLYCSPFLLVGLVHFFVKKPVVAEEKAGRLNLIYDFVIYSLAGSFLIGFLGLMFFFFGQMRYLVDVISQAAILAILGYWRLISIRQNTNSVLSKAAVAISNFLLLLTICISLLLAVTSETSRMEKLNPDLLDKITDSLSFEK